MLTPRQQQILDLIVNLYSETAEPIGSKTLLQKSFLNVSPATIRNDMMALEQLGLLNKAHSSSGRIPSFDGYRYFIEQLIESDLQALTLSELNEELRMRNQDLQDYVIKVTEKLSNLSGLPAVVYVENVKHRRMRHFKLSQLDNYQVIASVITDHGQIESQVFSLNYLLTPIQIEKIEQFIQMELSDLTLTDVYQRMKLTLPLQLQQLIGYQLDFSKLVKKAIEKYDQSQYFAFGKNSLFDIFDLNNPSEAWKIIFNILDGSEFWFDFLKSLDEGIDVTFNFEVGNVTFNNVSIVTAKRKVGSQIVTFALLGPASMQYKKVIHLLQQINRILSNNE